MELRYLQPVPVSTKAFRAVAGASIDHCMTEAVWVSLTQGVAVEFEFNKVCYRITSDKIRGAFTTYDVCGAG